jgi:hypothetical protein
LGEFLVVKRLLYTFLRSQKVIYIYIYFVESIPIGDRLVIDTDFDAGIAQAEHVEVAASEDPVQAEVIPGSDVPVVEEELAQDPVDDIDMADAHDSYDEVLAEAEDDVAGAQAADTRATVLLQLMGAQPK